MSSISCVLFSVVFVLDFVGSSVTTVLASKI